MGYVFLSFRNLKKNISQCDESSDIHWYVHSVKPRTRDIGFASKNVISENHDVFKDSKITH